MSRDESDREAARLLDTQPEDWASVVAALAAAIRDADGIVALERAFRMLDPLLASQPASMTLRIVAEAAGLESGKRLLKYRRKLYLRDGERVEVPEVEIRRQPFTFSFLFGDDARGRVDRWPVAHVEAWTDGADEPHEWFGVTPRHAFLMLVDPEPPWPLCGGSEAAWHERFMSDVGALGFRAGVGGMLGSAGIELKTAAGRYSGCWAGPPGPSSIDGPDPPDVEAYAWPEWWFSGSAHRAIKMRWREGHATAAVPGDLVEAVSDHVDALRPAETTTGPDEFMARTFGILPRLAMGCIPEFFSRGAGDEWTSQVRGSRRGEEVVPRIAFSRQGASLFAIVALKARGSDDVVAVLGAETPPELARLLGDIWPGFGIPERETCGICNNYVDECDCARTGRR